MSTATAIDLKEDIWSYQDYLRLPDDGKAYQIIGGELFMSPAPLVYHQTISRNLGFLIWDFVKRHNLGEVFFAPIDVIFSSTNVTQPDIIYIAKERLRIKEAKGIFGPPDWIIEILSPTTSDLDLRYKKVIYQRFGVREYWIVDPEEKKEKAPLAVETYFLKGGSYQEKKVFLQSDTIEVRTIEGLKINLAEVF